jgi:hypothetical protein
VAMSCRCSGCLRSCPRAWRCGTSLGVVDVQSRAAVEAVLTRCRSTLGVDALQRDQEAGEITGEGDGIADPAPGGNVPSIQRRTDHSHGYSLLGMPMASGTGIGSGRCGASSAAEQQAATTTSLRPGIMSEFCECPRRPTAACRSSCGARAPVGPTVTAGGRPASAG